MLLTSSYYGDLTLIANLYLYHCTDINEFNSPDSGGCDQNCSSTPGGYNCSCKWGFPMRENNTFVGKSIDKSLSIASYVLTNVLKYSVLMLGLPVSKWFMFEHYMV